jgi:radical SAM superfamily enzyme YgiQ (UPF0313 family)
MVDEKYLNTVPGLVYRQEGKIYVNPQMEETMDFDCVPFLYSILECEEDKVVYYESARGCPFKSGYCLSSIDKTIRPLSLDRVKADLGYFLYKKVMQVKFIDRTFNYDEKRAYEIFRYIIDNDKGVTNFHFEICADLLNDRLMRLLSRARKGLFDFEIGIQSTNIKANKAVYRIQNNEKLFHNIKMIQDAKVIDLHLDLIAGLPYEDYASFINTFNEVLSLRPKELQLGFLKLLKGTKLYNEKEKYGYKFNQNAPYDIICNDFLSEDDINNIHLAEEAFDRFYNKDYYKTSINFVLDNVSNHFNFFYQLGNVEIKSKRLEDTFKLLDDFVRENIDLDYDKFHQLLIIDYLNCFNIKPASWWSERISPKEKNEFLRVCFENGKLTEDLNTLYKYSLVIPLKESTIVVIYKNNTKKIYTI